MINRWISTFVRAKTRPKLRANITHAGSQKERHIHVGKLSFGSWYLVHGILVLVHGIWSQVLISGIG